MRELEADSEYMARIRAQDAERVELARLCALDQAELLSELGAIGIVAESVYDFVNAGGAPVAAVPVLVAHLDRVHHPRIWEGIVRALSVRHARDMALTRLVRVYRAERDAGRRWVLANAIGSMARFSEVADLDGIEEYRALFRQSRKPKRMPPAP